MCLMVASFTLSQKQIQVAQHLALGESQKQAGKAAGVSRATVCRWLKDTVFLSKIEEFRQELEQIEGSAYTETVKEVGESIRENVKKILTPDELKTMLSDMAQDLDLSPTLRLKAATQLAKWHGMEAPKPVSAADGRDDFPIKGLEGEEIPKDLKLLSDEELHRLYLEEMRKQK